MKKYILAFLVSMLPIIELRGGVPIAIGFGVDFIPAVVTCVLGNMLPVPFIYLFSRRFLTWGAERKYIGRYCKKLLVKGERAGQKLVKKTGRGGLFLALLLFVGIPLPGTGAWTGAMAASFLNMGFKSTVVAVGLGVILAGFIMAVGSTGVFAFIGL